MAADGRRHIIAVGGGMRAPEGQVPVHMANALRLTSKREPRLCVLNTAAGDDPRWTLGMYDRFAGQPAGSATCRCSRCRTSETPRTCCYRPT